MRHLTGVTKLPIEYSLFQVQNTKPLPFKKQNTLFLLHECLGLLTDAEYQPSGPMVQIHQFTISEDIYTLTICY